MAPRPPRPTSVLIVPWFLAVVWTVAAGTRPNSTFHLAPVLITLAAVAFAGPESTPKDLRRMAAYGASISLATTAGIALVGWSAGPSLLPIGNATVEGVVFTLGGAMLGLALGSRRRFGST